MNPKARTGFIDHVGIGVPDPHGIKLEAVSHTPEEIR
jgi:hypothetical protein